MKKINFSMAVKNLKKNFLLLFSTIAVLCLFISPSLLSLLPVAAVFAAVITAVSFGLPKPPVFYGRLSRAIVIFLALFIAVTGCTIFQRNWVSVYKVSVLAGILHLSAPKLVFLVGLIGCEAGFYAMYILSCWIALGLKLIKNQLPENRVSVLVGNLKRNWYFPVSAAVFFRLYATNASGYYAGILIAFVAAVIISSQFSSFWKYAGKSSIQLRVISVLTAFSICWRAQEFFLANWSTSSDAGIWKTIYPISSLQLTLVSVFGAAVSMFFVSICVIAFWKRIIRIFSETGIFRKIETWEWVFYGILLIVSLGLMVFVFVHSQGFYETDVNFNIIYSSDSPYLVKNNVYMTLTNSENDIRQPLFAVFAAPFIGIPYLLGKIFNAGPSLNAILVNSVQIIMLFAANLMLAKMIKLNPVKRACFMLLFYSTYTNMLFTLMMEQYIVAYFWLTLFVYMISEKKQQDHIAMWGAGGTLLTGMFFLPFFSDKSFVRDFKGWFLDTVKAGCEFVAVILVFCRFDVIYNLAERISFLGDFAGGNLTLIEKAFQYTKFILNYFIAPDAGPNTTNMEYITWQMYPVTGINFAGIAILFLAVISFILNRNKKSSLLSVCWIGFSVIILVFLGWGTKENGLILYELYFGWAILILLFQLVEKIENMLKIKFLLPVVSICTAGALFVINIPAVIEMIGFAAAFYPV